MHRAAVSEVVAVDGRDHGMFEIEMFDGLGDVGRFHRVEVHRLAFIDRAESAMPRAGVAAEHKCRGLVRPAFKDIRAFRFLADGVQIKPVDQFMT